MSLSNAVLDALAAAGATREQLLAAMKADIAEREARAARQVPWTLLRKMAFERDGDVCGWCGCTDGPFEVDHIVPRIDGGENILENVVVSCRSCNRAKKGRNEEDWSELSARRNNDRVRQRRKRERDKGVTKRDRHVTERDARDEPPVGSPKDIYQTPSLPPAQVSEANASSPSPRAWALPVGVSLQVWSDFLANRKRKRLGNTDTAWKGFNDDLSRIALKTGIPPPRLIEHAAAKGWGSINEPNGQSHERSKQASLSSVVGRILGDGGFDRGTSEDAGLGSANVDERGATRALATRGS